MDPSISRFSGTGQRTYFLLYLLIKKKTRYRVSIGTNKVLENFYGRKFYGKKFSSFRRWETIREKIFLKNVLNRAYENKSPPRQKKKYIFGPFCENKFPQRKYTFPQKLVLLFISFKIDFYTAYRYFHLTFNWEI